MAEQRKRNVVFSLCKFLSLNPESFAGNVGNDIKSLTTIILEAAHKANDDILKWVTFAEKFPSDANACSKALDELNGELLTKSVLVGGGLTPSEADIIVFATVHPSVVGLPDSDRKKVPHLLRWIDYIQNVNEFGELFDKVVLEKTPFDFSLQFKKASLENEVELNAKKTGKVAKDAITSETDSSAKKIAEVKNVTGKNEDSSQKQKLPEKVADEKDQGLSVTLLKIQVGLIRKASKHPSADSLLVEEIDVGESKCRQVVSGLAKYCNPDDLMNRLVVLITNVKPGKLRDVVSEGLVLCASSEDHTKVEPLLVPEGAKIGEYIVFPGHEGKPEEVLNPKKKQLEKITPHLYTDEKGVATFKGAPFMTSGGPCKSTIPNASIK